MDLDELCAFGKQHRIHIIEDACQAHGAAYKSTPVALRELGAEVITYGNQPDGKNINAGCGSIHPQHLCHKVQKHAAHIGIAHDGDADRVVLAFVRSAVDAGATAANYLEVTGWISDGKRVSGVTAQDRAGLNVLDIRARLIINATGPGSSTLTRNLPLPARPGAAPGLSRR